ncbi:RNA polymerase II accessory cdc73 family related protein [Cyclospora cayetanensis]|uniref:RNA polymerase II accessory cdc73 family related protein n=1 Tax=Cyclospora cayetanensis TaxID=88456 RepID=A0A1D3D9B0_9EIME|nr:RNA polymerase II accessory cdc73 family related protein [Cyclospora cayetanensis]
MSASTARSRSSAPAELSSSDSGAERCLNPLALLRAAYEDGVDSCMLQQVGGVERLVLQKRNCYIDAGAPSGIASRKREAYTVADLWLLLSTPKEAYNYLAITEKGHRYINVLERPKILHAISGPGNGLSCKATAAEATELRSCRAPGSASRALMQRAPLRRFCVRHAAGIPVSAEGVSIKRRIRNKEYTFKALECTYTPKFTQKDWASVVGVFLGGGSAEKTKWQFNEWPFQGWVELFQSFRGALFAYDEDAIPPEVLQWNIRVFRLSRSHRHNDAAVANDYWRFLEEFVLAPRQLRISSSKKICVSST